MALPGIYRPSRNKGRNNTKEKSPPQYKAEEEATKENKPIQRELKEEEISDDIRAITQAS